MIYLFKQALYLYRSLAFTTTVLCVDLQRFMNWLFECKCNFSMTKRSDTTTSDMLRNEWTWSAQIPNSPHHRNTATASSSAPLLRQSACLPLNSIVIHRTEFQLFKKSSGGEGNRCSKTVCPLSCDLFPIQITQSNSSHSGKRNSTWSQWGRNQEGSHQKSIWLW